MKRPIFLLLFLSAAILCGASYANAPQSQSPASQIAALRKDVDDLKAELAALKSTKPPAGDFGAALFEQRKLLDEMVAYFKTQAESARNLETMLDESQEKGFTYGINPDSRTVMLQGFHQFAAAIQANLPGVQKPKEGEEAEQHARR